MIRSLQGLRALGMIGIFLFHSGLLLKGTFPVTFFFMLSGFVLYYSYSNKIINISLRENVYWVVNRIKKLYPIHLITFAMSIFIRYDWVSKFELSDIFIKGILNLSLTQSLSKNSVFTFNGLSWFLSVTFILYILAIPLIILIKRIKNINLKYIIISILIIENIIVFINITKNLELNLYANPFFRVFDFALGMLVAKLYISRTNNEVSYKKYNLYEISIVLIFSVMYIITLFTSIKIEYGLTYYSPIFALAIYVFAFEKGIISKMLTINILQKIAGFSFEFYMVHELILILFRKVFIDLNYHWLIKNIIIAVPSLILSLILAILLNKYVTKKRIYFRNSSEKN